MTDLARVDAAVPDEVREVCRVLTAAGFQAVIVPPRSVVMTA